MRGLLLFIYCCLQCRGGDGVCPDTLLASGSGTQDISIVAGDVINNRRCIEYSRPLSTGKYTSKVMYNEPLLPHKSSDCYIRVFCS